MTPHEMNLHIGTRLRIIRILRGMSQAALAERLGVTFQQVQKYENGRNSIRASRLYALARTLGVPLAAFYDGLEDGPERLDELLRFYARLSPQFGARELLELNAAFTRIEDRSLRNSLRVLIAQIAAQEGGSPETGEAA